MGKSELILRFMEDHPGLYFLGKESEPELQQRELLELAAGFLDTPVLAHVQVGSWKAVLESIVQAWRGDGKLVLALDEFQWMAGASPELPSVLQELWDRSWRDSGSVMLILCGSAIGFMEREVLGRKSPLFGRRTGQIHLQPFTLRQARAFHPDWGLVEVARARMICGGVPLYLRRFDPSRSVEQNIQHELLDEYAPLFKEPEFLLREELRDVERYHTVLMALSSGSKPLRLLADETGIAARSLPYYLDRLRDLRFVRRRYPLTGKAPPKRQVRFELDDPLLRFWFSFVWPHTSFLAQMGPQRTFEVHVRPKLAAWFCKAFKQLCREALPMLYADQGLTASFEIGEYWSKDVQVDVVGLRSDDWTDIGECRWGSVDSPGAVVSELRQRAGRYPNSRGATVGLWVFGREARDDVEGVRWVGLEEVYGEGATS